jgi:hypothetical protein
MICYCTKSFTQRKKERKENGLGSKILTWIFTWCTKSFYNFTIFIKATDFWTQNSWLHLWLPFLRGLHYGPLINGFVKDLELVRYHIKEA